MKNLSMITLKGNRIFLRALEPEDIDFLFALENDEKMWMVSSTLAPFSKALLRNYLENCHRDIYEVKQLRLVICENETENPVGLIDLYDFDPTNKKVAVGLTIYPESEREKGFASEALRQISAYAYKFLDVHQIYADISEDNLPSIRLFENAGFLKTAIKKDWIHRHGEFLDIFIFQLIRP